MAFKKHKMNESIRKIILVLTAFPLLASSNTDCGGKAFHCLNSTHFMICVDLGGGVSSTIDNYIIPCPPSTVCQVTNHFECEFPSSTTTSPLINTSVDSGLGHSEVTISHENIMGTLPSEIASGIPVTDPAVSITTLQDQSVTNNDLVTATTWSTVEGNTVITTQNIVFDNIFNDLSTQRGIIGNTGAPEATELASTQSYTSTDSTTSILDIAKNNLTQTYFEESSTAKIITTTENIIPFNVDTIKPNEISAHWMTSDIPTTTIITDSFTTQQYIPTSNDFVSVTESFTVSEQKWNLSTSDKSIGTDSTTSSNGFEIRNKTDSTLDDGLNIIPNESVPVFTTSLDGRVDFSANLEMGITTSTSEPKLLPAVGKSNNTNLLTTEVNINGTDLKESPTLVRNLLPSDGTTYDTTETNASTLKLTTLKSMLKATNGLDPIINTSSITETTSFKPAVNDSTTPNLVVSKNNLPGSTIQYDKTTIFTNVYETDSPSTTANYYGLQTSPLTIEDTVTADSVNTEMTTLKENKFLPRMDSSISSYYDTTLMITEAETQIYVENTTEKSQETELKKLNVTQTDILDIKNVTDAAAIKGFNINDSSLPAIMLSTTQSPLVNDKVTEDSTRFMLEKSQFDANLFKGSENIIIGQEIKEHITTENTNNPVQDTSTQHMTSDFGISTTDKISQMVISDVAKPTLPLLSTDAYMNKDYQIISEQALDTARTSFPKGLLQNTYTTPSYYDSTGLFNFATNQETLITEITQQNFVDTTEITTLGYTLPDPGIVPIDLDYVGSTNGSLANDKYNVSSTSDKSFVITNELNQVGTKTTPDYYDKTGLLDFATTIETYSIITDTPQQHFADTAEITTLHNALLKDTINIVPKDTGNVSSSSANDQYDNVIKTSEKNLVLTNEANQMSTEKNITQTDNIIGSTGSNVSQTMTVSDMLVTDTNIAIQNDLHKKGLLTLQEEQVTIRIDITNTEVVTDAAQTVSSLVTTNSTTIMPADDSQPSIHLLKHVNFTTPSSLTEPKREVHSVTKESLFSKSSVGLPQEKKHTIANSLSTPTHFIENTNNNPVGVEIRGSHLDKLPLSLIKPTNNPGDINANQEEKSNKLSLTTHGTILTQTQHTEFFPVITQEATSEGQLLYDTTTNTNHAEITSGAKVVATTESKPNNEATKKVTLTNNTPDEQVIFGSKLKGNIVTETRSANNVLDSLMTNPESQKMSAGQTATHEIPFQDGSVINAINRTIAGQSLIFKNSSKSSFTTNSVNAEITPDQHVSKLQDAITSDQLATLENKQIGISFEKQNTVNFLGPAESKFNLSATNAHNTVMNATVATFEVQSKDTPKEQPLPINTNQQIVQENTRNDRIINTVKRTDAPAQTSIFYDGMKNEYISKIQGAQTASAHATAPDRQIINKINMIITTSIKQETPTASTIHLTAHVSTKAPHFVKPPIDSQFKQVVAMVPQPENVDMGLVITPENETNGKLKNDQKYDESTQQHVATSGSSLKNGIAIDTPYATSTASQWSTFEEVLDGPLTSNIQTTETTSVQNFVKSRSKNTELTSSSLFPLGVKSKDETASENEYDQITPNNLTPDISRPARKDEGVTETQTTKSYFNNVDNYKSTPVNIESSSNNQAPHLNLYPNIYSNNRLSLTGHDPMNSYCSTRRRGRYPDAEDCTKFYICIGPNQPIVGKCPANTVFSDLKKQCTKNKSHCLKEKEFHCLSTGRFSDVLKHNVYYICVRNAHNFVRFKFQCQNGYFLNKTAVKCIKQMESLHQSISIDNISNSEISASEGNNSREKTKSEDAIKTAKKSKEEFECKKEGKFAYPDNCREYYICTKNKKSEFRRRRKSCDSDELFHKDKKKCVDADSHEC